ncbi:MAG TPA: DUF1592 domain-containing protein, partial [Polyangiaceae bacterium]|nr:DUF1592 domain-containing protein [Polyangiaceae bacterium]
MTWTKVLGGALLALSASCGGSAEPATTQSGPPEQSLAPALRRLSTAELEASATTLLGIDTGLAVALPPDARQSDYSRNVAQSVDSLLLGQLFDASRSVSGAIDLSLPQFPSCARTAAATDAVCAETTVKQLTRTAFRRAPTGPEIEKLLGLFTLGAEGADFKSGIALVVRGLLGSPKFLYASTLGSGAPGAAPGSSRLSNDELGSELSLLISGQPPDEELLLAAAHGDLESGAERERQALRLLQSYRARFLYRRFVQEWLGLVGLEGLAKSSQVITDFPTLREAMVEETNQFVDDVFSLQGGSVSTLLAGGFNIVPAPLANFY